MKTSLTAPLMLMEDHEPQLLAHIKHVRLQLTSFSHLLCFQTCLKSNLCLFKLFFLSNMSKIKQKSSVYCHMRQRKGETPQNIEVVTSSCLTLTKLIFGWLSEKLWSGFCKLTKISVYSLYASHCVTWLSERIWNHAANSHPWTRIVRRKFHANMFLLSGLGLIMRSSPGQTFSPSESKHLCKVQDLNINSHVNSTAVILRGWTASRFKRVVVVVVGERAACALPSISSSWPGSHSCAYTKPHIEASF